MTAPDSSLLLPVLFAKPGLATVPVMRLSLVPQGGGSPHQSVSLPLGALDRGHEPASARILANLLPRYDRLDCYTTGYRYPPRDVNEFVGDFPEGYSHLLAVLLGFYALGADATLGSQTFRGRLAGWTASTYPDKQGRLQPVTRLKEKLAAIFDENPELERLGCHRITHVLLSTRDRERVATLLGVPAHGLGCSVELAQGHLAAAEDARRAHGGQGSRLTVHFAESFEAALGLVFGSQRLRRYRRALAFRKIRRSKALWAALLLIAAATVTAFLLLRGNRPIVRVQIVGKSSVEAHDAEGRTIWLKEMGSDVATAKLMTDREGRTRVVVGLQRHGTAPGHVVAFDSDGHELWRFRPAYRSPYTGEKYLHVSTRWLLIADLLPEPGQEIVAVFVCSWFPCRVCILSEDGKLLREMWHPGVVDGLVRLAATNRLVFWACNNALTYEQQADPPVAPFYPRALFCIEADKLAGQCPPHRAPGIPGAPLRWYKILTPRGRAFDTKAVRLVAEPGPDGVRLELWTTGGWVLYLSADGEVLDRGHGDEYENPPTDLIDIPADPADEPLPDKPGH